MIDSVSLEDSKTGLLTRQLKRLWSFLLLKIYRMICQSNQDPSSNAAVIKLEHSMYEIVGRNKEMFIARSFLPGD